jgi:hypothetical protein
VELSEGVAEVRLDGAVDLTTGEPVPGAPFDLVYARLLLMHLPNPVRALRRLWELVAAGAHLVIQDYHLHTISAAPALDTIIEFRRVAVDALIAAGREPDLGHRLPL